MHLTCSCESIANLPFRLSQRILSEERWKKETQDYLVSGFKFQELLTWLSMLMVQMRGKCVEDTREEFEGRPIYSEMEASVHRIWMNLLDGLVDGSWIRYSTMNKQAHWEKRNHIYKLGLGITTFEQYFNFMEKDSKNVQWIATFIKMQYQCISHISN